MHLPTLAILDQDLVQIPLVFLQPLELGMLHEVSLALYQY